MNGAGLRVEGARDCYFLSGEFLGVLLVAERERILAIVEDIRRAMRTVASKSAFDVIRAHSHSRVITRGAHVVSNGTSESALALRGGDGCNKEQTKDERFHWCCLSLQCQL